MVVYVNLEAPPLHPKSQVFDEQFVGYSDGIFEIFLV